MILNQKALEAAIIQIGVESVSKNSNAGPEIEIYLKYVGLPKGYYWCIAFVYWCVQKADIQMEVTNHLKRTVGVQNQYYL